VINHNEAFPRLEFVRRVKRTKGVEVYGPYVTGSNIWEVLQILTKSFSLRDCKLSDFKTRKEPCLLYQMNQCSAPCVGKITQSEYQKDLALACDMFSGNGVKAIREIEKKMHEAAEALEFERAALIRDNLSKLIEFANNFKQSNAEIDSEKNIDIVAFYKGELEIDKIED
jgi:excinuclease ABC subunit C